MADVKWPPSSSSAPSTAVDVTFAPVAPRSSTSSARAGSASSEHGSSSHRTDQMSSRLKGSFDKDRVTTPARSQIPTLRPGSGGGFLLRTPTPKKPDHIKRKIRKEKAPVTVEQSPGSQRSSLRVSQLSEDSSLRSSPLTRELSNDYSVTGDDVPTSNSSQSSRMDPAQLVRMALDLSESRKRNVSGSLHVPLPTATRNLSNSQKHASLPSRSNNKRISGHRDDWGRSSTQSRDSDQLHPLTQPFTDAGINGTYDFSPATLSRAEKARKYFELASEHRKLLRHLPPVIPQASETTEMPVDGRAYNPLQTLRNRRLRTREKRPYTAPVESWQDLEMVKDWTAELETAAEQSEQSSSTKLELPIYSGDGGLNGDVRASTVTGHRRTNTVNSTIMRPESGWTVDPSELLADTYWTEQGNNKTLLEDRRGDRIFPQRQSHEHPSRGGDSNRNDEDGERSKGRVRGQTLLHNPFPRTRRSSSATSVSSTEAAPLTNDDREENIGPLERHMQQMIHLDERGELPSPDTVSPDKWGLNSSPFNDDGRQISENSGNDSKGNLSVKPHFLHRRAISADAHVGIVSHDSNRGDLEGSVSPVAPGVVPPMGMDLTSPPRSKSPVRHHKSRFHGLSKFRAHSKERGNTEYTDFASKLPTTQPRASFESSRHSHHRHKQTESAAGSLRRHETNTSKSRLSFESSRPSFQRHRPTDSWTGGLRRYEASGEESTKEPSSSVSRFFKGGRIGDLVRSESSKLGDRMRSKDDASDRWDDENDAYNGVTSGDSEPSPRTSLDRGRTRPRYNIPTLPTFKSPAILKGEPADNDPISRQQRARREANKSDRLDKLAPPRIHPPDDTDPNNNGHISFRDGSASPDNIGPKPVPRNDRLANGEQRHWSISDQRQSERSNRVAMHDVARVKALLLSSGIKAREIGRSADQSRDEPLLYIKKVSSLVGKQLHAPSKRQEHQIAAQALSEDLVSTLSAFDRSLNQFQNDVVRSLSSELDDLQHKATDQLTKLVHETSDDADAFTVELTTKQPQDIKRIDDAIDDLLRRRRRQFRILRRTGFKLLEWMVLGLMWWIWFIVVLINTARKAVLGFIHFIYWLVRF